MKAGLVIGSVIAALGGSVVVAGPVSAAVVKPDFGVKLDGPGGVEMHVLEGQRAWDTWAMHSTTGVGRVDPGRWKFVVGDANADNVADLYAIDTLDNNG